MISRGMLAIAACAGLVAASPSPTATSVASGAASTPPAPPASATPHPSPGAIAPLDATEFDIKLTAFRAGFDVKINGRTIGRMVDSSSESTITSAVRHGLNHVHVRWFSEGQPSTGSLAVRARRSPTASWQYVIKIRKYPFSPSDGEADATFEFDPPAKVPPV